MKIMVLGASGIIGQHMRLNEPRAIDVVWVRRDPDIMHVGVDLNDMDAVIRLLMRERPDVIVNLAGESRPDVVEQSPDHHRFINAELPDRLMSFGVRNNIHLVQVSTQAVFDGATPPYHADSPRRAINAYGAQKLEAEQRVARYSSNWTIVRPTFVLGVRPMPRVGRQNPAEQMMEGQARQVDDRFFSIAFAEDVASAIWLAACGSPRMRAINVGSGRFSRYSIGKKFDLGVEPASHDEFIGVARRPPDTTYAGGIYPDDFVYSDDFIDSKIEYLRDLHMDRERVGIAQRAREIALFGLTREIEAYEQLAKGFDYHHDMVTRSFRAFGVANDDDLLRWYEGTDAYIWELSAYHLDQRFNYRGMCAGVSGGLKTAGARSVVVLGDGVGDLTLRLLNDGFIATYNDLDGSLISKFAEMRLWMYTGKMPDMVLSRGWDPPEFGMADAVCASDFLEHVTDVEKWVAAVYRALRPGGVFFAQNAFACGSGDDGPMPMHLARNDRFEKDWDPLLASIGFEQMSSNWYKKPGRLAHDAPEPMASVAAV